MYFIWSENLIFLSFVILALLSVYDSSINIVLLYLIMITFVYGNIKRIHSSKYITVTRIARRIGFLVPLFSVLYFGFYANWNIKIIIFSILGCVFSVCLQAINYRSWRLYLTKDIILMQKGDTYTQYITKIMYLIGTAIGEEIFFRNFMIGYTNYPAIMLVISTLSFVNMHVGSKWGKKFTKYDVINQTIFGFFSGVLFILSNSCWPSIIGHLIFNSPHVLMNIKCIYYKKQKAFIN